MATVIRSLGINGISGYPLGVEVAIIAVLAVPGRTSTNSSKSGVLGHSERDLAIVGTG